MIRISLYFLLTALTFLLVVPAPIMAAKKFVPKKATSGKSTVKKTGSTIPSLVRYRSDKQGVLLSFSNFNGIDSVNYTFVYTTNGVAQGAGGTITANNNPASERQLLFGTCSTSVCTYHYNLTGAKLTLTARYTNGTSRTKNYRIKTYQ